MRIAILVYNGFDELDAIGPLEVFQNAGQLGGDFSTTIVTRTKQATVTASHGLTIVPHGVFEPGAYDAVLMVGGGWNTRTSDSAWGEVQRGDWSHLLRTEHDNGTLIMSVCTGAMILAHAGITKGKRTATHHTAWDDLVSTGAVLVPDRVVRDGNVITCGGVTSGIDLALYVVETLGSEALAKAVGRQMEY